MSAFNPIPAPNLIARIEAEAIGVDVRSLIADFAEAGLIKSYARMVAKCGSPAPDEIRDARIGRDIWQRINRANAAGSVWSVGSVRLAGDDDPELSIIGLRFEEAAVRQALKKHGVALGRTSKAAVAPTSSAPESNEDDGAPPVTPPPPTPVSPKRSAPSLNSVEFVTAQEAKHHLRCGQTTLYQLVKNGQLDGIKRGRSRLISTASIRRYLGIA